jgi:DNA-binding transcriptional LysR family regulator
MIEGRTNLDMDALRTFLTGIELGSFAKAAERLARSQSAISAQLRKLEGQVGQPLVRKSGRGLAPTEAGESLLAHARRILEMNDEALAALRGAAVEGAVRLGLPQDFAETWLPDVLGSFTRAHPKVRVDVRVERNADLVESVLKGRLDLALTWETDTPAPHAEPVAVLPVVWIGAADRPLPVYSKRDPLPLLGFEAPCVFRSCTLAALDKARIPWRLAFTSTSLAGLWAAAAAGLGVAVRTPVGMAPGLAILDPRAAKLPALPKVGLSLQAAEADPTPAVSRLREIMRDALRAALAPVQARRR